MVSDEVPISNVNKFLDAMVGVRAHLAVGQDHVKLSKSCADQAQFGEIA